MDNFLKDKHILFFSPSFFGYENKIKDKMEKLGARVDMFDERSVNKSYHKALLKINPNIFNKKTEKYYFDILEKIKSNNYDFILFIKCDMPTGKVLQIYKNTFKKAKMCLHMWDSISNIPNIENKFKYFDHITSFDRQDSLNNPIIKFRPLFYCDEYKKEICKTDDYEYDLCIIGTIHSDRYKIIKEIKKQAENRGLKMYCYPYLQSKFIYYFYKITKKEFRDTKISDFEFNKISSKDIASKVDQSRVIIDIQHPKQTGLTMRTIEMLGMNKKLITTNQDISNYDFYDCHNILVFDRQNSNIKLSSLSEQYKAVDSHIYDKYYIDAWIYEVLGGKL